MNAPILDTLPNKGNVQEGRGILVDVSTNDQSVVLQEIYEESKGTLQDVINNVADGVSGSDFIEGVQDNDNRLSVEALKVMNGHYNSTVKRLNRTAKGLAIEELPIIDTLLEATDVEDAPASFIKGEIHAGYKEVVENAQLCAAKAVEQSGYALTNMYSHYRERHDELTNCLQGLDNAVKRTKALSGTHINDHTFSGRDAYLISVVLKKSRLFLVDDVMEGLCGFEHILEHVIDSQELNLQTIQGILDGFLKDESQTKKFALTVKPSQYFDFITQKVEGVDREYYKLVSKPLLGGVSVVLTGCDFDDTDLHRPFVEGLVQSQTDYNNIGTDSIRTLRADQIWDVYQHTKNINKLICRALSLETQMRDVLVTIDKLIQRNINCFMDRQVSPKHYLDFVGTILNTTNQPLTSLLCHALLVSEMSAAYIKMSAKQILDM